MTQRTPMTDADETMSFQQQLAAHRRTLAVLLRQLANLGADHAPPGVHNGIAEARAEIARLKAALRDGGVALDDQVGDMAAPDEMKVIAQPRAGDAVSGDKVGGDKIGGDKITIGTAYFQGASTSLPIDTAAAQAALACLPTDHVPDPAPLPPGSRMPLCVNPLFVGRQYDLQKLAATLKMGTTTVIAAATGMGGIGKTQLASEFAHRYGQFFLGGVFWLSFADPSSIDAEIAASGAALDLPGFAALDFPDQVFQMRQLWQAATPRLLVFDNCEAEDLLARYRPTSGGCRVLVTSRRPHWDAGLGVQRHALDTLLRAESIALLRKFRPDLLEDDVDLDAIAAELGDLPLALHLAGSFLARYRHVIMPAAYLVQLRDPALLQHRSLRGAVGRSPTGHDLDVGRTFALSYERLDPHGPIDGLAIQLLSCASYFAPDAPIPRSLLPIMVESLDADTVVSTALRREDAMTRLIELGLLEDDATETLRLHRLLSVFVRALAVDDTAQDVVEALVLALANEFNIAGYPAQILALLPHLRIVTDRALVRADASAARLCCTMDECLSLIGDYSGARLYSERALEINEQVLGPAHLDTARSLNNLGELLRVQGDYSAAHPYLERALQIREQALEAEHPAIANSLSNLGLLLLSQGDLAGARPYFERALRTREQVLGPEHPDTARLLNNLGALLQSQGDLAGARPYLERALQIREQVLGPEHPAIANSLNNLGLLLQMQGDYSAARPYLERALQIREQVLRPAHPDTAQTLNDLGYLLQDQGDYSAARPYLERALQIREQVLGPEHPDTANSLNNLAALLQTQGNYSAARPYLERALQINENMLGPEHPDTAHTLHNLAALLRAQGDLPGARRYYERALQINENVLGPEHPHTAHTLHNLAVLLSSQGDVATAQLYHERALVIRETALGPNHLDTAQSLWWLGTLLGEAGDRAGARAHLERAAAIYTHSLGEQHPTTQECQQQLAALDAPPSTAEQQIADLTARVEAVVAAALADSTIDRTALADQIEVVAQQAEEGGVEGSPLLSLAAHLRALATRLAEPPDASIDADR